jgi:hypothetical protein
MLFLIKTILHNNNPITALSIGMLIAKNNIMPLTLLEIKSIFGTYFINHQLKEMKNLKFIFTAAFAISSLMATAQVSNRVGDSDGRLLSTKREKGQPATGSMYLNEKFMPARLSNSQNTMMLRYNAYSDYFEMNDQQAEETQNLPKTEGVVITFVNNNESYTVVNYKTEKGESVSGYLNIISDSPKVKIYRRESIILQPEVVPNNSYAAYKPANYKKAGDEFYIKINDGEAVYIDGKKDVAKLVPAKSKDILDFIKKNKIDLEDEIGLQKLGSYMETIL